KIVSKVSPLSRRELAGLVVQLVSPVTLKDPAAWKKTSAPFVDALPDGTLERAARARRVLVIPHEMLWRLPFEALPAGTGYLGATAAFTYTPSVSSRLATGPLPVAPDTGG